MQEKAGALCVGDVVYISESLVNYRTHKTSPAKNILCSIFNARKCRHQEDTMWVSLTTEIASWTTAHTPAKNDNVLFFNSYYSC